MIRPLKRREKKTAGLGFYDSRTRKNSRVSVYHCGRRRARGDVLKEPLGSIPDVDGGQSSTPVEQASTRWHPSKMMVTRGWWW